MTYSFSGEKVSLILSSCEVMCDIRNVGKSVSLFPSCWSQRPNPQMLELNRVYIQTFSQWRFIFIFKKRFLNLLVCSFVLNLNHIS